MKTAVPNSQVARFRRRGGNYPAMQTEFFFGDAFGASIEGPETPLPMGRTHADPLRHAEYLAKQIKRGPVDAETRRATVRALCADLVQSLTGQLPT
jgi:hypothetical protein